MKPIVYSCWFYQYERREHEYFKPLFYWDRTLWETALAIDPQLQKKLLLIHYDLKIYNEIFIGHTPVTKINKPFL